MLFNSLEFAFFLPIVFFIYWFITNKNIKAQNILLLVSSYIFYGWWDWRFLTLIAFSSFVDYFVGLNLSNTTSPKKRKLLLLTSIVINLGFLGFFKYFNFFTESFADAFTLFGRPFEASRLNIVLPVGISFYTFQTLSYSIDVYKKKLEPTKDIIAFFSFVSFFPQLVAGPIERASNLLPQFYHKRKFDYYKAVDGIRQILWGLFKKIVIADNCAKYVNEVFSNYSELSSSTLILGVIFFSFQIYGDFSGYSDIAIGTGRLFGFNLKQNFSFPYFSRNIAEFWRRWHISLTTWFRDYLYIPIGGSKGNKWMKIRNVFIIFLVSGFWHGANWTFLFWGFLNALYFLPLMLSGNNRNYDHSKEEKKIFPPFLDVLKIFTTFLLVSLTWILFRSESIPKALEYFVAIFTRSILSPPEMMSNSIIRLFFFLFFLISVEWLQRYKKHGLELDNVKIPHFIKWSIYYAIILLIILFGGNQQEFIYFQF